MGVQAPTGEVRTVSFAPKQVSPHGSSRKEHVTESRWQAAVTHDCLALIRYYDFSLVSIAVCSEYRKLVGVAKPCLQWIHSFALRDYSGKPKLYNTPAEVTATYCLPSMA